MKKNISKCPKNNKNCLPNLIYKCKNKNFICSGTGKKPTGYKKDFVWICMRGALSKTEIEMTVQEASFVISVLASTLGQIAPAIIKKPKPPI